jgi:hypothetical protein
VNHFQHCDADGGSAQFFRQIGYAVAGDTWDAIYGNYGTFTPGLFTMGISPAASDLATDYTLHTANETHNTDTYWSDFGFADQLLYAVLLNPRYVALWVHGAWDSTEPYAFDAQEKAFANRSAKLLNTVPYINNLTYAYRPSGHSLSTLSSSEVGSKPSWITTNASASEGVFWSLAKETGSMWQLVASNLQTSTRSLTVTLSSDAFATHGLDSLVAFNASDGSSWVTLNDTAGERSFTIPLANSSFQVWKFGAPFEVLGLPFEYDGWPHSGNSTYPSASGIEFYSYSLNNLTVNVSSPTDQFFKFYVTDHSAPWSLTLNGLTYNSSNTIQTSSAPSYMGLLSGGLIPGDGDGGNGGNGGDGGEEEETPPSGGGPITEEDSDLNQSAWPGFGPSRPRIFTSLNPVIVAAAAVILLVIAAGAALQRTGGSGGSGGWDVVSNADTAKAWRKKRRRSRKL